MNLWNAYIVRVTRNCGSSEVKGKDLAYWRDNLFAGAIIYLLPFCLIALLPGLYWSFVTGLQILALVDVVTVTALMLVAFMPGISPAVRKTIFMLCMYILSCILLYYLGLYGPGLVYLFASCIFSILIISSSNTFWPAWVNTVICFLFGVAIAFKILPWPQDRDHSAGAWIAVCSNVIFLSFLSAALIPRLFNGLQETIDKEKQLKEELHAQQQSLQHASNMLQRKNKELEQFAYVASHDLKEPIRMVTNFIGLLKSKYNGQLDDKAHIYIDYALDGSKRMKKMIDDLLELSRTARQDSIRETVNLDDLLQEVKKNIFHLIEESRADIILKTEMPVLAVYRTDIICLLQNLLSNAIKFRKTGINPVIIIKAIEQEDDWQFSIEDNGIGIKKEKCELIFEIFARLHTRQNYEGTGIGLALCKKVVEYHGGRIWVESEEGKGSVFYFTIKNEYYGNN